MTITESVKEAIWLKDLFEDISAETDFISVFRDSQSIIHLAKDQMYHDISKHIDVKFHFVRQMTSKGIVEIKKIATTHNPADMMTKPIPTAKFNYYAELISLCS
jgi:hypothetical protein